MFNVFKCKHRAEYLAVEKEHTIKELEYKDFYLVTYYLLCINCGQKITVSHVKVDVDKLFEV